MTIQTPATLKGYFETGDIPTQANFSDLIESAMAFTTATAIGTPGNWNIHEQTVLFDEAPNTVFYWGNNTAGAGGRIDETKHAIWQQMEYDYYNVGQHFSEWSLNVCQADSTLHRFVHFCVDNQNLRDAHFIFYIGDQGSSQFAIVSHYDDAMAFMVTSANGGTTWIKHLVFLIDNAYVSKTGGGGTMHFNLGVRFMGNIGFYETTPIAKQTGVAVTAEAIHAALVALGLIGA